MDCLDDDNDEAALFRPGGADWGILGGGAAPFLHPEGCRLGAPRVSLRGSPYCPGCVGHRGEGVILKLTFNASIGLQFWASIESSWFNFPLSEPGLCLKGLEICTLQKVKGHSSGLWPERRPAASRPVGVGPLKKLWSEIENKRKGHPFPSSLFQNCMKTNDAPGGDKAPSFIDFWATSSIADSLT